MEGTFDGTRTPNVGQRGVLEIGDPQNHPENGGFFNRKTIGLDVPHCKRPPLFKDYPLVICYIAIENVHL